MFRRVAASRWQHAPVVSAAARRAPDAHRRPRRCDQSGAARGAVSRREHAGGDDRAGGGVPRARPPDGALHRSRALGVSHAHGERGHVDKTRLTQVGRALAQLGIEHIPAYSPHARGRSERLNRTFQDRLVNELRAARIAATSRDCRRCDRDVLEPQESEMRSAPCRRRVERKAVVQSHRMMIGTTETAIWFTCHQSSARTWLCMSSRRL